MYKVPYTTKYTINTCTQKFENSEIISDPELVYILLDDAEKALKLKFGEKPTPNAVVNMANLLLNIELAQDDLADEEQATE